MSHKWKRAVCCVLATVSCIPASASELTNWGLLNSNFVFHLQCESNLPYVIQGSTNLAQWITVMRSVSGGTNRSFLTDKLQPHLFFRAVQTNEPLFTFALATRHGLDLFGNNLRVDSFDSGNPLYSTGGRWVVTKARAYGNVGCNDTITNNVPVGNFTVSGKVSTGPYGNLPLGPNSAVGSLAWNAVGNTGIQPGYFADDMNGGFPAAVMPVSSGAWLPMPGAVGGVITFNSSGSYRVDSSGPVSGKLIVAAPNVRLRVDGGMSVSGTGSITISSNASITIYLNCPSANIGGQGVINSGMASQCYILGTPTLKTLALGGNGEATCAVYAPHADVTLPGGGAGEQDFSGAIVANSLRFTAHYNIHFDESLLRSAPIE